jgi:hypothetical protein
MTEAEWNACTDHIIMLDYLRARASDRKLRLFAVACCRRVWDHLRDPRSKEAVEWLERYYDGLGGRGALKRARSLSQLASQALGDAINDEREASLAWHVHAAEAVVAAACATSAGSAAYNAAWHVVTAVTYKENGYHSPGIETRRAELLAQAELLRHISNPWRERPRPRGALSLVGSLVRWLGLEPGSQWPVSVISAARRIHKEAHACGDLHAALLETSYADLAEHFREEQMHPRGCWALDLILGKN